MPNLFDLTGAMADVDRILEENEGELTPELEAVLDGLEMAFDEKAEAIARVIAMKKAMAGAVKEEADRLAKRKQSFERSADSLRRYLHLGMVAAKQRKVETATATIFITKGRDRAEVATPSALPEKYLVEQAPTIDRAAILADLKAGKKIPGAVLAKGADSLTIKR